MASHVLGVPGIDGSVEIGRGGFGVVYRATESDLGRDVAVKVITGEPDEQSIARFDRECRAMGALSGHPHIVTIFRNGRTDDGSPYLVMEFLAGGSLSELLEVENSEPAPSRWTEAIRIGIELSGALETAHHNGVLHRDVKPGNVLFDELGRAKLADFGIARLADGPETRSAVITASLAHAPPEVISGHRPDERSDVYSLASTVFELANGTAAFVRSTDESMVPILARVANDPVPDLRLRGVPEGFASLLERAMSKSPAERPASAAEFGRALIEVQRQLGLPETPLWAPVDVAETYSSPTTTVVVPPPTHAPTHHQGSQPGPSTPISTPTHVAPPVPLTRHGTNDVPTGRSTVLVPLVAIAVVLVVVLGVIGLVVTQRDRSPEAADAEPLFSETSSQSSVVASSPPSTVPTRPVFLSDAPALPAAAPPYSGSRVLFDQNSALTFSVPSEWVDEIVDPGQVITSPDNNAALGGDVVPGALVFAAQAFGSFDADFALQGWLDSSFDPSNPCVEVFRDIFVDGPFDGLSQGELCNGGAMLVVNIVVSDPARQSVVGLTFQLVDERDFAVVEQVLASFVLLDPSLLPAG